MSRPLRCFPRRSTASAGPCSATGSTCTAATPAPPTNTIIGTTTKHFRRLNLKDRGTWEELPVRAVAARRDPGRSSRSALSHRRHVGSSKARRARTTWSPSPILPGSIRSRRPGPTCPHCRRPARRMTPSSWATSFTSWAVGRCAAVIPTSAEFLEDALVFDLSGDRARWETPAGASVSATRACGGRDQGESLRTRRVRRGRQGRQVGRDLRPGDESLDARAGIARQQTSRGLHLRRSGLAEKLYVSGFDGLLASAE